MVTKNRNTIQSEVTPPLMVSVTRRCSMAARHSAPSTKKLMA